MYRKDVYAYGLPRACFKGVVRIRRDDCLLIAVSIMESSSN